jgi:hypothetical protein
MIDPFLRHSAALSLLQEVKILNKYLENIPERDGYSPFLIRIQLSVLPKKRSQPYDVYTDVSILPGTLGLGNGWIGSLPSLEVPDDGKSGSMFDCNKLYSEVEKSSRAAIADRERRGAPPRELPGDRYPEVIPLLVTDNLESTSGQKISLEVRKILIQSGFPQAKVPMHATLEKSDGADVSASGRDVNSLFTMAQLNDSSVRVRVGAMKTPFGYSMISSTHNITLLVLVPEGMTHVAVASKSHLRDADTGVRLPFATAEDLRETLDDAMGILRSVGALGNSTWALGPFVFQEPTWWRYGQVVGNLTRISILRYLAFSNSYEEFNACLSQWGWAGVGSLEAALLWLEALDGATIEGDSIRYVKVPGAD